MQEMQLRRKHEMNESLLILGKFKVSLLVIYRLEIIQQILIGKGIYKR